MRSLYGDLSDRRNWSRLVQHVYRDDVFRERFLKRGFERSEIELLNGPSEPSFPALVEYVLEQTAHTHGRSGWGNKKPSYALLPREDIDGLFPRARFVHIVRDGRDVVLSMRRASHLLVEKNWYFAARDWRDHVQQGRRLGAGLGPSRYLEIRYEDLLQDPVEVFARMLQFLGGDEQDAERLAQIGPGVRAAIKPGNTAKWKTQIPPHGIRVVERVAGPLLEELAYPLQNGAAARQPFGWAQVGAFQVDRVLRRTFDRSLGKAVRYRAQILRTRGRALLGRVRIAGRG
jgi:hypothetical protein